jgi:hypothetical protein
MRVPTGAHDISIRPSRPLPRNRRFAPSRRRAASCRRTGHLPRFPVRREGPSAALSFGPRRGRPRAGNDDRYDPHRGARQCARSASIRSRSSWGHRPPHPSVAPNPISAPAATSPRPAEMARMRRASPVAVPTRSILARGRLSAASGSPGREPGPETRAGPDCAGCPRRELSRTPPRATAPRRLRRGSSTDDASRTRDIWIVPIVNPDGARLQRPHSGQSDGGGGRTAGRTATGLWRRPQPGTTATGRAGTTSARPAQLGGVCGTTPSPSRGMAPAISSTPALCLRLFHSYGDPVSLSWGYDTKEHPG